MSERTSTQAAVEVVAEWMAGKDGNGLVRHLADLEWRIANALGAACRQGQEDMKQRAVEAADNMHNHYAAKAIAALEVRDE